MSEFGRQRHAAELRTVDVGNAVVLRQPLVDERVVGGQQVEDAAILLDDAGEEQLDLALERAAQVVVEVGEEVDDRLGWSSAQRTPSHWPVKLRDQRLGARIRAASGAPAARAPPDPRSRPCAATSISSSSGMLLHRKNDRREASARSVMR